MDVFHTEGAQLLIDALMALETKEEYADFLEDLLTTKEMLDMSQRIMVAKLLTEKKVYNKIAEQTGASSATISRVNRAFTYGKDGYKTVFKRLNRGKDNDIE